MTDTSLQACLDAVGPLAAAICRALGAEVAKLGFPPGRVVIATPAQAQYRLDRDPASGTDSLVGVWRDAAGHKYGELLFHADGTFYAEHDVVQPHPLRDHWFVESVIAWGRGGTIKSEPRLLPALR